MEDDQAKDRELQLQCLLTYYLEVQEDKYECGYCGPDTCTQLADLRPGRLYALRVVPLPDVLPPLALPPPQAPSQPALLLTQPAAPDAPPAPTTTRRERKALLFRWREPEETGGLPIERYRLQISPPPAGADDDVNEEGFVEVCCGLPEGLKHRVPRLEPGTTYSARVQAENAVGASPWSALCRSGTSATVPGQPTPPSVVSATPTVAVVHWIAPFDGGAELTEYMLESDDGRGGELHSVYQGMQTEVEVGGLQSGLTYRFRVTAFNEEGRSLPSAFGEGATAATAPGAPPAPALVGANRSSVTVAWAAPSADGGSAVVGYEVELQPKSAAAVQDGMPADWVLVYQGSSTACTLGGLRAGCTYRMRAYRLELGSGAVDESGGLRFTPVHLEDGGLACCARVEGLEPGLRYLFRVAAINAEGSSDHSEIGTASTMAAPPGRPSAPRLVSAAGAFSLRLAWSEAQPRGAPIMAYTLAMAVFDAVSSPPAPATPTQGGSPCGERLAPGSLAPDLAAGLDQGMPDAGTADKPGATGVPNGGTAHGLPGSGQSAASARELAAKAALATVYTGPGLLTEVKGLDAFTEYLFCVRATNSAGAGHWSELARIATAPASPTEPLRVVAAAASSSSMFVAWDPPAACRGSPITSYYVEVAEAKAATSAAARGKRAPAWRAAHTGDVTSCRVDDLRPGRPYCFRVRASNARGAGPWGNETAAETAPGPPDAPSDVTTWQRTATSLRVRWAPPAQEHGAPVLRYRVEVAEDGGEWRLAWTGAASAATAARVEALQPATRHSLRVGAANAVGEGPWSAPASAATLRLPPAAPLDVQAEPCNGPALLVRWRVAEGDTMHAGPASHEVEAAEAPGGAGAPGARHTAPGRARELALGGLAPGATYQVRVRSVGMEGAGHSAWSAATTATLPGPRAPSLSAEGPSSGAAGRPAGQALGAAAALGKRRAPKTTAEGGLEAEGVRQTTRRGEMRGAATRAVAKPPKPWIKWRKMNWRRVRQWVSAVLAVVAVIFVIHLIVTEH
ncbi:hypothetical protein WJX81_006001 [Elliptochloris bilobata]|uniref:Fibronectin type-III domain-containing protein n=1 Tax=Elliptochloris bilobata TaxID=381761 RepID=A0AAW1SDL3_9CHLO